MIKNKKSQHEMVGFVLIVIIVSIIGIILLSLFLNKKDTHSSEEVSSLLQSIMYYTTDCYSSNNEPKEVEDLINDCNKNENKKCLDGTNVCKSLEATLTKAFDESLRPGELYKNKAYKLQINFGSVGSNEESLKSILTLNNGNFKNCTSIEGATHTILVQSAFGGSIDVNLLVCKGGTGEDFLD